MKKILRYANNVTCSTSHK